MYIKKKVKKRLKINIFEIFEYSNIGVMSVTRSLFVFPLYDSTSLLENVLWLN